MLPTESSREQDKVSYREIPSRRVRKRLLGDAGQLRSRAVLGTDLLQRAVHARTKGACTAETAQHFKHSCDELSC